MHIFNDEDYYRLSEEYDDLKRRYTKLAKDHARLVASVPPKEEYVEAPTALVQRGLDQRMIDSLKKD